MADWELEEKNKLYVNGEVVKEFDGEISVADVKSVARSQGLSKISVKDKDEAKIPERDFPFEADVFVTSVNKAG